jgi:hypothetical protein
MEATPTRPVHDTTTYDLPPTQRATVVTLLKVLLAEVISDAAPGSERMHNQGADNEQDHH